MIHPLAQADVPSLASFMQAILAGGGTATLAVLSYLWIRRVIRPGADLTDAEARHKAEMERTEARHAEEVQGWQERAEKFERMVLELLTTNRELTHAAGRATEVAEKTVEKVKIKAGAAHER